MSLIAFKYSSCFRSPQLSLWPSSYCPDTGQVLACYPLLTPSLALHLVSVQTLSTQGVLYTGGWFRACVFPMVSCQLVPEVD